MPKICAGLNTEQLAAVRHAGGPLLIVAGPGTGKTRTLTHRIAHLIGEKIAAPQHILAVTFTRKAAFEMRERLGRLIGAGAVMPMVTTFHALCVKILTEMAGAKFGIADENDRRYFIRDAAGLAPAGVSKITLTAGQLLKGIEAVKQEKENAQAAGNAAKNPEHLWFREVYQKYKDLLSIQGLVDFDDLITTTVRYLEIEGPVRRQCRERFQYVFVDEYQDLNRGQYRILNALVPPGPVAQKEDSRCRHLCVIGDPDQSIYGFRGSDSDYFQNFTKDYPDATVVHLDRNYRSTETILKTACQVIQKQRVVRPAARIHSGIDGLKYIRILESPSEKAEAVAVGKTIEQMVGGMGMHAMDFGTIDGNALEEQRGFSDFAVLFRTGAQAAIFGDILENAGIPCQTASRENRIDSSGPSEVIAYLKIMAGTGSFADLDKISGVEKKGVGQKTLGLFKNWAYLNRCSLEAALQAAVRRPIPGMPAGAQLKLADFSKSIIHLKEAATPLPVAAKIDLVTEQTGLRHMVAKDQQAGEKVTALKREALSYDSDTSAFIGDMVLQSDTDAYDEKAEKVSLITMHASKGLEFPVVFIAGCEDQLIPFQRPGESVDRDEERRLFYVAMTRAREVLYLSYATRRNLYGRTVDRSISPFVADIQKHLVRHAENKAGKKSRQIQLELF